MTIKKNQEQQLIFEKALSELNDKQWEAVSNIDGTALVLAGPGTGKTQLLATKVGYILQETETNPESILCLTFSDAGVKAMRQRLQQLIGNTALKISVNTFHSFCNQVIRENSWLFGNYQLNQMSDLDNIELIRELLDSLPPTNPLTQNVSNPYQFEFYLKTLFKRIKSEAWNVEEMIGQIREYSDALDTHPDYVYKVNKKGQYQKGDLKTSQLRQDRERFARTIAGLELYEHYRRLCTEKALYDFDDMILWVLEAFQKNEDLLRNYQERFLYFLVDEYQDTNGAQNKLIALLTEFWENPNIFLVGDDDQSIYEFQGARIKNLTDFYEKHKDYIQITSLDKNYRSAQTILDYAADVIHFNTKRVVNDLRELGIEKKLKASKQYLDDSITQVSVFETVHEEIIWLTNRILELKEQGVPLKEMAVLYYKHEQAEDLRDYLQKIGIPYQTQRKINITEHLLIRFFLKLLEYLADEQEFAGKGEAVLYWILQHPCFKIRRTTLDEIGIRKAQESQLFLLSILEEYKEKDEAIANFLDFRASILQSFSTQSLPEVMESIWRKSGLMVWVASQPEVDFSFQLIKTLFNFVRTELRKNPFLDIRLLLNKIETMNKNNLSIAMEQFGFQQDGVWLMTAHGSKGLEFEAVFLFNCTETTWGTKSKKGGGSFKFPESITFDYEEDELEAKRRVFYVAMTRAKRFLYISHSQTNVKDGKALEPLSFLTELLQHSDLQAIQESVSREKLSEYIAFSLTKEAPKQYFPSPKTVKELIQGYELSASSLIEYRSCPLSFYAYHILNLPNSTSPSAILGTCLHAVIYWMFKQMQHLKALPDLKSCHLRLEDILKRERGYFAANEWDKITQKAHLILEDFYQSISYSPQSYQLEHSIKNVHFNGIPLKGTIDRVEHLTDVQYLISDYKTSSSTEKVKKLSLKTQKIGDYRLQLLFYKLIYELRYIGSIVSKGQIIRLGINPPERVETIHFEASEITWLKEEIQTQYAKIQNLEFGNCDNEKCPVCSLWKGFSTDDTSLVERLEDLDDNL